MPITQDAINLIKERVGTLMEDSGRVVVVNVLGECIQYGDVVEKLDQLHHRKDLLRFCIGAESSLGHGAYVVFKLRDKSMQIIPREDFQQHLPCGEYKSPIPT